MTEHRVCTLPGALDGEWCRYYCPNYGTGVCRYDADTKEMLVKVEERKEPIGEGDWE